MNGAEQSVVGFFPDFSSGRIGGIEESARLAWAEITKRTTAQLVTFPAVNGLTTFQKQLKRVQTIREVRNLRQHFDLILVWHSGLLKLLPFLDKPPASLVVFLHGIENWRKHGPVMTRLLQRVDLFLTNSEFTWDKFISLNPSLSKAPRVCVPLGLGAPSSSFNEGTSGVRAVMLSRLAKSEDYKGHREVISAWRGVRERISGAELIIAGEGDLRSDLERLAVSEKVDDCVHFVGQISEAEKEKLLREARCFLMPSRGEGFGLVYLEAMRLGKPCLVSDADAGREVVNPPEAGLAVDPRDSISLTNAICELLEARNGFAQSARQRYESNFTAERFQKRLSNALFTDV
ncbi:MAG TPA: glycosyltransferase family 4 protein [Pyrinomonadaceae bacterium]